MAAVVWGAMQRAVLGNAAMSRTVCAPLGAAALSASREFAKQAAAAEKKTKIKEEKIKKPKTAYIFFTLEARSQVISDKPTSSFGEISSMWHAHFTVYPDVSWSSHCFCTSCYSVCDVKRMINIVDVMCRLSHTSVELGLSATNKSQLRSTAISEEDSKPLDRVGQLAETYEVDNDYTTSFDTIDIAARVYG
eukprot:1194421-Prorocentrum_minimum.AAC.10